MTVVLVLLGVSAYCFGGLLVTWVVAALDGFEALYLWPVDRSVSSPMQNWAAGAWLLWPLFVVRFVLLLLPAIALFWGAQRMWSVLRRVPLGRLVRWVIASGERLRRRDGAP